MLPATQQLLSRHIINPEIVVKQHSIDRSQVTLFNYEDFCGMINFWKIVLVEKYQAKSGQTVMIEFLSPNIYYFTAIFAAFELGLVLIVDWPHAKNEDDVKSHRMTMHGKIDFAIVNYGQTQPDDPHYDYWDYRRTTENCNVVITDRDFDIYVIQDPELYTKISTEIYATPESDAIWSASGGTTGLAKQTRVTHRQTYLEAERLIKPLGFSRDDISLHVRNLHHGASMVYHWLPSIMVAKEHLFFTYHHHVKEIVPTIISEKITKVQLYTQQTVLDYLHETPRLDHALDIITLFNTTDKAIDLIKEKNINSVRVVFGDTTIGLGFFVKIIDQSITEQEFIKSRNCVGKKFDDHFDFKIENGVLHIAVPCLNKGWATSGDRFECVNDLYYFYGRSNRYRIGDEWITLGDLDAKVDQLFGSGATVIIDEYYEKLYLSLWKPNPEAEEEFKKYISSQFNHIQINKIARNLDFNKFFGSRKIDRQKLKDEFRKL
jgi:acyl-CoA synthetase (AMP-forming)/AMP-acid ligase II